MKRRSLVRLALLGVIASACASGPGVSAPAFDGSTERPLPSDPRGLALEMMTGTFNNRWAAERKLTELGPRAQAAVPLLGRACATTVSHRERYVNLLGAIGGDAAIELLRAELASPLGAHAEAVGALARQGKAAAPATTELRAAAEGSPFIAVRAQAAALLHELGVTDAAAGPRRCPTRIDETPKRNDGTATPYRVTLTEGTFEFSRLTPNHDERCFKPSIRDGDRVYGREELVGWELSYAFEHACVIGLDKGEWGGVLNIHTGDDFSRYVFGSLNPKRIVEAGGRTFLLSGIWHLGLARGAVFELTWMTGLPTLRPFARLPGEPEAYHVDADGRLWLLVSGPEASTWGSQQFQQLGPSCEVAPYTRNLWAVRLDQDGHLTVVD